MKCLRMFIGVLARNQSGQVEARLDQSTTKWEIFLPPLMEEYRMLWSEMNNRWTQQQNLIATAWTVLGATIAFVGVVGSRDKTAILTEKSILALVLLAPLFLYFLFGIFVRHDDKNSRIVAYLYTDLRPRVQAIINKMCEPTTLNVEMIKIWRWPNFELPKAMEKRFWSIPFHLFIEGSRYFMMLAPSFLLLGWISHFHTEKVSVVGCFTLDGCGPFGVIKILFLIDVAGLIVGLILGGIVMKQMKQALNAACEMQFFN